MEASLRNLGEGSYAGGLCVEEGSGMGVSPFRGPAEGLGKGGPSTRKFEMDEAGSRDGVSLFEEDLC